MFPRSLRWLFAIGGLLLIAILVAIAKPALHVWRAASRDTATAPITGNGVVNDASRLNATTITQAIKVAATTATAEAQLRDLIARATRDKLAVSIAGARHSMGGHTIYPGGIAVDMLPFNYMHLDTTTDILHVGAGARWSEIVPYLNQYGRSVAVMQSNSSFSVGGSISVNCHGWQTRRPPIASTVESFRLMKADGQIVRCSREDNPEMFSLVLGGYGLFGIILDVDLRVVPNERYKVERIEVPVELYASTLEQRATVQIGASMVYGRLDITSKGFLKQALLNVWRTIPHTQGTSAPLVTLPQPDLRRNLFRGSVGSEYGKDLRWWCECNLEIPLGATATFRNNMLDVGVEVYENRSEQDTDILHEYFVPPSGFARFVGLVQKIIPRHRADLLNITVRDVAQDHDTFLRYADGPMLCLVMLFNQRRTAAGESAMQALTSDLIDAALACNGRYYLPYRLHASIEQFDRAYPQARRFFDLKRILDPEEIFRNQFYLEYGHRALQQ